MMRLLLTGGGTAGHINPALSVARYFTEERNDVSCAYVGNANRMEAQLVPMAGLPFYGLTTRGLSRSFSFKGVSNNVSALLEQQQAKKVCRSILKEFLPDVVLATGGYVCVPVMQAAFRLGIPALIHESNALPGLSTKLVARRAAEVLLATGEIQGRLPKGCRTVVTGSPVDPAILRADRVKARRKFGLNESDCCILSFGGSLGAETINRVMAKVIAQTADLKEAHYIHATGSYYVKDFPLFLTENGVDVSALGSRLHLREYIDDMPDCLAAADLVLSRSGAITINEIGCAGKASILIPSPNVAENHQYYNAMVLGAVGAAFVHSEKELSLALLVSEVRELILDREKRQEMGQKAKGTAVLDANQRIASEILKFAQNREDIT